VIALDKDGVVADFFTTALQWHGGMPFLKTWPRGTYDMATPLGLSTAEFYEPLKRPEFWEEVRPYPGALDFVEALRELDAVKVFTVTSGDHGICGTAKREWCSYHLHVRRENVILFTSPQEKVDAVLAAHALLIDDHKETCDAVTRKGGRAVFVPRPWSTEDPAEVFRSVDYINVLHNVRRHYRGQQ